MLEYRCIPRDENQHLQLTAESIFDLSPLAVVEYGLVDDTYSNCAEVTKRGGWAIPVSPENPCFLMTALQERFHLRLKQFAELPRSLSMHFKPESKVKLQEEEKSKSILRSSR